MKFFIPHAKDDSEAESVYGGFAQFVYARLPDPSKRIWKLTWEHNKMKMSCEVGSPLPAYYQTGNEPVRAIFDCGDLYKICTPNRGGIRGEPVLAGKDWSRARQFSSL